MYHHHLASRSTQSLLAFSLLSSLSFSISYSTAFAKLNSIFFSSLKRLPSIPQPWMTSIITIVATYSLTSTGFSTLNNSLRPLCSLSLSLSKALDGVSQAPHSHYPRQRPHLILPLILDPALISLLVSSLISRPLSSYHVSFPPCSLPFSLTCCPNQVPKLR